MKKLIYSIIALAAVVSCGKEEFSEQMPEGEKVALTIPQTKVGLDGNSYAFEAGDVIIALASNGRSVATLTNTADAVSVFSGTFSEPLQDSKSISLYYNCSDASGNVSYTQNGKPWLVALGQEYTRDEDSNIRISAALDAPEGVKAVGVVSTCGATSFDFHAFGAAVSSFDGSSFSGDNAVSNVALVGDGSQKTAFINVPAGMEGGFWLKFSDAEGHSMYKKYASSTAVSSNMKVAVSEFVPADVKLSVSITGFPTSYSWYVGNEGISGISGKDVSTANSKTNDWMGAGVASYSIEKSGIPTSLLTFDSFKLVVDGDSFTYSGEEGKSISVGETTGHNTWGQKDITATVTYKTIDGVEFTQSTTITRHITGLPYVANPPKNTGDNPWKRERGSEGGLGTDTHITWNNDNVSLATTGGSPQIVSPTFNVPNDINVSVSTKIHKSDDSRGDETIFGIKYYVEIWNDSNNYIFRERITKNQTVERVFDNAVMTNSNNTWHICYTYAAIGPQMFIYYFNINYR